MNGIWKYRLDQNDMGYRQSWYLEKEASAPGWKEIKVPHNWYLEEKDKNEVLAEENSHLREKLSAIGGIGDDM